ncbi:MAG TPA: alpha/beta hydrolase [Phenylobacterium sp.]|nr:alpha/beta hydrolase [Phenylobacterium sp.]
MVTQLCHRQVDADGLSIHVIEAGTGLSAPILCLHGWLEDASSFAGVLGELGRDAHVLAMDLPEVGGSSGAPPRYDARTLAGCVRAVIAAMGLRDVTLVGHDVGALVTHAYLRAFPGELTRAALLNIAIPGVDPWDEVERNPHIWHFAFHAVPELPELLVSGHERRYFDFFYDAIGGPRGVPEAARAAYAKAYSRPEALHAGFEWYRAFAGAAKANRAATGRTVETPVLYIRGDKEIGRIEDYVAGLRKAGLAKVTSRVLTECGHFSADEQPAQLAQVLRDFVGVTAARPLTASSG